MTKTGWLGEGPDEAPAMPLTSKLLANREPWDVGDGLALARAHSAMSPREERAEPEPEPLDPDEIAAKLIIQGYVPGSQQALSQRLGDVLAELQDEREKIERAERRREHFAREQAAGRLSGLDIHRMNDTDGGDVVRAEKLERRADSLRRQLADAGAKLAPAQRNQPLDGVEAASRHARQVLGWVGSGAPVAGEEARQPVTRPKEAASSAVAVAVRSEHICCAKCQDAGVRDADEELRLHEWMGANAALAAHLQDNLTPYEVPAQRAEVERLMELGYSRESAELAAVPVARRAMIER